MYLMFKSPGPVSASSKSIAGQVGHMSDCTSRRMLVPHKPVNPQAIKDLEISRLEESYRMEKWAEHKRQWKLGRITRDMT